VPCSLLHYEGYYVITSPQGGTFYGPVLPVIESVIIIQSVHWQVNWVAGKCGGMICFTRLKMNNIYPIFPSKLSSPHPTFSFVAAKLNEGHQVFCLVVQVTQSCKSNSSQTSANAGREPLWAGPTRDTWRWAMPDLSPGLGEWTLSFFEVQEHGWNSAYTPKSSNWKAQASLWE
jgi:hypothetical protein